MQHLPQPRRGRQALASLASVVFGVAGLLRGASAPQPVTLPDGMKTNSVQPIDLRGRIAGKPVEVKDRMFSVSLGAFAPASFLVQ